MRISDSMISNNYVGSINDIKNKISVINKQILTGKKIDKPSDSPVGTSRLIRFADQDGQIKTFQKNIQNSLSFLDDTVFALESIQSESMNIISKLTELQNPINQTNLNLYADMIDNSLKIMIETANTKSDGRYVFGGTDYSNKPFGISSDNQSYQFNTNPSGKIRVKVSQSVTQDINLPGQDVFGTIISSQGYFDSAAAAGSVTNSTTTIYDSLGNSYQLQTNFEKTAANTYQMAYDIIDGAGNTVFAAPPSAKVIEFNPLNGNLVSVDGSTTNLSFQVDVPSNRIQFTMNLTSLSERNAPSSINLNPNQQMDIFNTLKQISEGLRNGILPNDDQLDTVNKFNSRLTAKQSEVGNMINQISTIDNMLEQQSFNLQELAQKENGVDIARAIVDLQNQDYLLQVSQKIGSIVLTRSLLDYL